MTYGLHLMESLGIIQVPHLSFHIFVTILDNTPSIWRNLQRFTVAFQDFFSWTSAFIWMVVILRDGIFECSDAISIKFKRTQEQLRGVREGTTLWPPSRARCGCLGARHSTTKSGAWTVLFLQKGQERPLQGLCEYCKEITDCLELSCLALPPPSNPF